jgi:hypothetical protein
MVEDMGGYKILKPLQWFLRQFAPERYTGEAAE